ncbi:MAG: polysaccharide biosynthesis protein [Candidatus Peribacteraceae bacterium]|nr:polysaccharide biosynthesis protein [Candidatus Peribacteraceae bacterium]MDD5739981.1 polysaccharide biosynthesis protein [Candidatus Peribacteraceae bacterium]
MSFFQDKTILVTGGTGSIGSEVVRQLLALKSKTIRVLSRDEHKQYLFQQELGPETQLTVRYLLGDIRDYARLLRAMEGVDYVFHCAAYKHVPFCEYNSFEAVKTNVIGTQNMIDAAIAQGVSRVLLISTDKAASPSNVMGATKLLAEKMMTSAMNFSGDRPIRFASVRFGNVLASRGSVLPLFCKQIEHGGPVTVTNPEMIRFFMSIPQAVSLLFHAMERMEGGELFILKMPVLRLGDMVEVLIEELAPRFGHAPASIKRQVIGARPGEKTEEILMTAEEAQYAVEENAMFIVRPPILLEGGKWSETAKKGIVKNGDAAHAAPLSKEQIRTLLAGVLAEYFQQSRLHS